MATSGRFGLRQGLGDGVDLGRQQRPGAGGLRVLGDAVGGGLGAVRGAEGVVHEDVAQLRHLLRQLGLVLLLALVQAAVLQQHHLAGLDGHAVDPVGLQAHRTAEQLGHARRHRGQRVLRLELALGGAAQVRGDHHRRAGLQALADGRQRGADAGVLGDVAGVVLRHVEVGADEDALTLELASGDQVGEAEDVQSSHYQCIPSLRKR
jgi:hypothetical protein